jgi:hypothetical protein
VSFLEQLGVSLNFPDYFGKNWDALEDCMTDEDWLKSSGAVIVITGIDEFVLAMPFQFNIAMDIFRDAVNYWKKLKRELLILIDSKEDLKLPPFKKDLI